MYICRFQSPGGKGALMLTLKLLIGRNKRYVQKLRPKFKTFKAFYPKTILYNRRYPET